MSTAPSKPPAPPASFPHRGIKVFTYPKIIFIWPTFVAAVISAIIMASIHNDTTDPRREAAKAEAARGEVAKANAVKAGDAKAGAPGAEAGAEGTAKAGATPKRPLVRRFGSPQNVAGMLFLSVFLLNLIIMSVDFPRFTIIALFLGAAVLILGFLYLNVYFEILEPITNALESLFAVANSTFYGLIATIILINFAVIWVTRYLDYWVIMPNEILHNHGPFSDLERFPTFNLKFDKEIPDILEYALLGAGRLVLHVTNERRAIVLENVLWIDAKENELKKIMSRMDVRVTTDQEAAEPS
jgi:hypothetical protein